MKVPAGSLEYAFYAALSAAVSGQADACAVEMLDRATLPFAFYIVRSDEHEEGLDGHYEIAHAVVEVHVVARALAEVLSLCAAVEAGLEAVQGTLSPVLPSGSPLQRILWERVSVSQSSPDLREHEINAFRRVLTVDIDYQ